MKKVISILSFIVATFTISVSAQINSNATPSAGGDKPMDQFSLNFFVKEGSNTIPVPNGRGTIRLVKRGTSYSDVVFTDAAGKSTRLAPANSSTGNAPKPECKYPLPDACFGTSQNIGLCICKPNQISSGSETEILIGLLLPAINAAREAGRRTQ